MGLIEIAGDSSDTGFLKRVSEYIE